MRLLFSIINGEKGTIETRPRTSDWNNSMLECASAAQVFVLAIAVCELSFNNPRTADIPTPYNVDPHLLGITVAQRNLLLSIFLSGHKNDIAAHNTTDIGTLTKPRSCARNISSAPLRLHFVDRIMCKTPRA